MKYSDSYCCKVGYTHPDTYKNYPWIGIESSASLTGSNLFVAHIPESTLDGLDLFQIISSGLAGIAIGIALSGIVGLLVGGFVLVLGVLINDIIINKYIRDEAQAGWMWLQNFGSAWWGFGSDIKVGKIMWFRFGETLNVPYAYPLWYGGKELGINGM